MPAKLEGKHVPVGGEELQQGGMCVEGVHEKDRLSAHLRVVRERWAEKGRFSLTTVPASGIRWMHVSGHKTSAGVNGIKRYLEVTSRCRDE